MPRKFKTIAMLRAEQDKRAQKIAHDKLRLAIGSASDKTSGCKIKGPIFQAPVPLSQRYLGCKTDDTMYIRPVKIRKVKVKDKFDGYWS
jgi:hypothetical protein